MNILPALMTATAVLCGLPVLASADQTSRKPAPQGAAPAGSDAELVALCEAYLEADIAALDADLAVDAAKCAAARASDPEEKARLRKEVPMLAARYCELHAAREALESRLLDAPPATTLAGAAALARVVAWHFGEPGGVDDAGDRFALNLARSVAELGSDAR